MISVEVSFAEYLKAKQSGLSNGILHLLEEKGITFKDGKPFPRLSTAEDYERNVLIITQELKP